MLYDGRVLSRPRDCLETTLLSSSLDSVLQVSQCWSVQKLVSSVPSDARLELRFGVRVPSDDLDLVRLLTGPEWVLFLGSVRIVSVLVRSVVSG